MASIIGIFVAAGGEVCGARASAANGAARIGQRATHAVFGRTPSCDAYGCNSRGRRRSSTLTTRTTLSIPYSAYLMSAGPTVYLETFGC